MARNTWSRLTLVLSLALWAWGGQQAQAQMEGKPNVVVIIADDLGWSDLGVYGSDFHETPNLDRMARQGLRFTDGYAAAPLCSPTRASLLTGRTPASLHITEHFRGYPSPEPWQPLIPPRQRDRLPLELPTLAEVLNEAGYATAHIGKWHLGWGGSQPEDHGFDTNIAGSGRGLPPTFFYPYLGPDAEQDLFGEPIQAEREGEYLTDRLTDEAIGYLEAHRDSAFFLHLAYYAPHVPIEGKPALVEKYAAKRDSGTYAFANPEYAAMVEAIDENVGRLLDALDRLGLAEETLVLFVSDNGGLSVESSEPVFAPHTPATPNDPLRAGKGYLYEGGVRVPFIAQWPGTIPEGQTSAAPVSTIDILPTVTDFAGLAAPDSVEGVSLRPVLTDEGPLERNTLYWHLPHYSPQGERPTSTIREGPLKLVVALDDTSRSLYNLEEDPDESNDLAEERPDVAARLYEKLVAWRDSINAQMPTPNPDFDPQAPVPPRYQRPQPDTIQAKAPPTSATPADTAAPPLYKNAEAPVEDRVDDLLGRMTLEEKVGQLVQYSAHGSNEAAYEDQVRGGEVGSYLNVAFNWMTVDTSGVYQENPNQFLTAGAERTNKLQRIAVEESRLGIPVLFAHDVIHGFRTIFPVPIGMASTWSEEAVRRAARIAAVEASSTGVRWIFAPMIDVSRDPRWGRIVESAGEDPYLNAVLGGGAVRGFQTDDLSDSTAAIATPKHFVAYGAAEGGRDYNTVDVSERTLRETYLPPFKASLDAGARSVMVAFNEIGGIPATANEFTVDEILREEWGFDGIVVSDWGSVYELLNHGYAETLAEAAEKSIKAGVDIDMESRAYARHLADLVESGRVDTARVDAAARRVLRAKLRLGLFDSPYVDEGRADRVLFSEAHAQAAREIAAQSLVLLKNEGDLLPLDVSQDTIAVIGALADDAKAQLGSWFAAGSRGDAVTVLAGIREAVGDSARVIYARGAAPDTSDASGIVAAVAAAERAGVAVLVLGETATMSGEAKSRATLDLPGAQQALLEAVHETGTPVVLVLMNGRPLALPWAAENVPAIVEAWFPGTMAGPAVADVLFGEVNPSGKLPVTFPRAVGMVPYHYNHKNTGRPGVGDYIDVENTPLFPFGHGLSYTTFEYSDLSFSDTTMTPSGEIEVSTTLTNTGERAGTETVQLYLRDMVGSATRPVLELKGFERVTLQPGASETVTFTLDPDALRFLSAEMERVVEPGAFEVKIGTSSAEGLMGRFRVVAETTDD